MLINVLNQVVFYTITRFYTIFSQRLHGIPQFKKLLSEGHKKIFANKQMLIFIVNAPMEKSSRFITEVQGCSILCECKK